MVTSSSKAHVRYHAKFIGTRFKDPLSHPRTGTSRPSPFVAHVVAKKCNVASRPPRVPRRQACNILYAMSLAG